MIITVNIPNNPGAVEALGDIEAYCYEVSEYVNDDDVAEAFSLIAEALTAATAEYTSDNAPTERQLDLRWGHE